MTGKEAIEELRLHLKMCEALMPAEWQEEHGAGSRFGEAVEIARSALELVPPCKIGDDVWGIRGCSGYGAIAQGSVSQMFYTSDMKLCVAVNGVCRGEFGERVFWAREEAERKLEEIKRQKEKKLVWI